MKGSPVRIWASASNYESDRANLRASSGGSFFVSGQCFAPGVGERGLSALAEEIRPSEDRGRLVVRRGANRRAARLESKGRISARNLRRTRLFGGSRLP